MDNIWKKIDRRYFTTAVIALFVFFFMKYLLPLILPFALAAFIIIPIHPWLARLEKKTKIGKAFLTTGILLAAGSVILVLFWLLIVWGGSQAAKIPGGLEQIEKCFCSLVQEGCRMMEEKTGLDAAMVENFVLERANIFIEHFQLQIVPRLMNRSVSYIKTVGSMIAFVGITLIAAILLVKDYDIIIEKSRQLRGFKIVEEITGRIIKLIHTFFKAQLIILSIMGAISALGLLLAGIQGAFAIGVLTGLMDALPFIGTGIVLLPIAFWQLIKGNYLAAVICVVTYAVCAIAREYLEPRLIGKKMGIYPVAILISIYAGVKIYGISGIVLGPLSVLIIKEIYILLAEEKEPDHKMINGQ